MKLQVALSFLIAARLTLLAGAADVRYRVVPLEPPQPNTNFLYTTGHTINDSGMVVGLVDRTYETPYPSGSIKGLFVHIDEDGFQEIGDYQGTSTQPNRLNNRGQAAVICWSGYETNGTWFYFEDAVRYTPGVGFERLGDLSGNYTRALGINSRGDVVGTANTQATNHFDYNHAFLYTDEHGMVDLGTFGGRSAAGVDINDDGWICGGSVFPAVGYTAWIYHEWAGMIPLGPGVATRINELGVVVQSGYDLYATLVFPDGRRVPMRSSPEVTSDGFGDLNDWNVVVDTGIRPLANTVIGSIWTEREGMRDLNRLIDTNSGWFINDASAINNHGQISGAGRRGSRQQAIRLDPIPPKAVIACEGTNVVLSWVPAWPGITVESSASVDSTHWSTIPPGVTNSVTIPMTEGSRFFRLNLEALRGQCCVPEPGESRAHRPVARIGYLWSTNVVSGRFPPIYDPVPAGWLQIIAANGRDVRLVFQGVGYDADEDPLSFEWSVAAGEGADWRVIAATRWVTNRFEPGIHQIQLRVSDGPLWGGDQRTVEILTPADLLRRTVAFIEARSDQVWGAGHFLELLREALDRFEAEDLGGGLSALEQAWEWVGLRGYVILADQEADSSVSSLTLRLKNVVNEEITGSP